MLQAGPNGIALIPNAPRDRYTDEETGAHFDFFDMCKRLEKILIQRQNHSSKTHIINQGFQIQNYAKEKVNSNKQ